MALIPTLIRPMALLPLAVLTVGQHTFDLAVELRLLAVPSPDDGGRGPSVRSTPMLGQLGRHTTGS